MIAAKRTGFSPALARQLVKWELAGETVMADKKNIRLGD
jgi:hypothetical protein